MNITLTRKGPLGLGEQIKRQIRLLINSGELPPDGALPSARDAAAAWGVNRNTVWRAYRDLAGEGLLRMVQGSGAFVRGGRGRDDHQALTGIAAEAFARARGLGYAPSEIMEHFLDYLASRQVSGRGRLALVVECNRESLDSLAEALERELELKTRRVLIQTLEQDPEEAVSCLRGVDLVVCGFNHAEEFSRAAPDCPAPIIPVLLRPQSRFLGLLASLPPGTKVGFTCANRRSTENLFKHQVFSAGRSLVRILAGLDDPGPLERMLQQCDLIFASFAVYDQIKKLAGPQKKVYRVDAPPDPTGIEMVRQGLADLEEA